ncbi:hypothetical protein HMPREF1008_00779 [Olsenella sp. oral taxon 809 str. F0356]|uniref:HAD-IIB family hydrolase n=1 Tax=Olsenella sp. oral taxon 809 TaxID=661086 RepID=UPI000231ECC2|nr:HAD-IIB family hydrolase [Olsenella sp. oral taxon 809]EHF02374.1 hypothetical protein HMPREF1008_00779 [Olsenella sp. oral taxon 809 str. F0356]
MLAKPRLLALDMDGTLLNSQKRVSPRTLSAVRELADSGVVVALSTGRGLAEIADYSRELAFLTHASLDSGGLVYDLRARRQIHLSPIPREELVACLDAAAAQDAMVHLATCALSVVQRGLIARCPEFNVGVYRPMFERNYTEVDDLRSYALAHADEVVKVDIHHHDAAARDRSRATLEATTTLALADAEVGSLECTPRGVNKASGLRRLCELLGVPMELAVAVGDDDNDLAVLRAAGMGVAMGNANERVRTACDLVVADCDHDGIVEVIERLF